jgi:hypothetical protein
MPLDAGRKIQAENSQVVEKPGKNAATRRLRGLAFKHYTAIVRAKRS